MRIIANGNDNVIIEASPHEVNMLAGKNLYEWSSYYDKWNSCPRPGTTFDVVAGISQLHHNSKRTEEVNRLKKQLQSIILQLELVEPFMKEPEPNASEKEGTA